MAISLEAFRKRIEMDELSIFVKSELDWFACKEAVKNTLQIEGEDCSDENVRRHQWIANGYEVLLIASPGYDDDCGIPFSQYSHQVLILDAAMNSRENRESDYELFVRNFAKEMERSIPNDLVIVKNLQSIVVYGRT